MKSQTDVDLMSVCTRFLAMILRNFTSFSVNKEDILSQNWLKYQMK